MTAPVVTLRSLDEAHRARQGQNALAVQRLVAQLFVQMIEPYNIAGTAQPWLQQAMTAILRGRQSSIQLAIAYATAVRRLQVPDAPAFTIPKPEDPPVQQLLRSLTYTGPGKLAVTLAKTPKPVEPDRYDPEADFQLYDRELAQYEQNLREAPAKAAVMASAAAYRHVTNGGRDLIDSVVTHDPLVTGWVRITKANPCYFCAMLASRGPAYGEQSFDRSDARFDGPGEHKVHDGCGCSLRPIYGSKSTKNWPEPSREFERLWLTSGAKYSGERAILEFRRAYEGRSVPRVRSEEAAS